jgi:hypothetical protein
MGAMPVEMTDANRADGNIQLDLRVRRWLAGVPLSTIVVLVDAILDEMEVRARPRHRGSRGGLRRPVPTDAPRVRRRTAEPAERHLPE